MNMATQPQKPPASATSFLELVRKKAAKWPSERGFSKDNWSLAWSASSNNGEVERALFEAGLVFDVLFRELRTLIEDTYKRQPKVTRSQLIRAYTGIANRDRTIIAKPGVMRGFDLTATRTNNNRIGNELSSQEIADGCVDAIECAVRSTLNRPFAQVACDDAFEALVFMDKEVTISQLYATYEDYWLSLVWGDYQFCCIDSENGTYEVRQIDSDRSISFEVSQIRRAKLFAQSVPIVCDGKFYSILSGRTCIDVLKSGKRKIAISKRVGDLDDQYQIINALFVLQQSYLQDNFPKSFIDSDHSSIGFTIQDSLEVFRLLVLLAHLSQGRFPSDDSVSSLKKAIEFSPRILRAELIRALVKATQFSFEKCSKILEFLTFKGGRDQDLWCYPLVELDGGEITYLVAALVSPVLQRVVEHWLAKLKVDIADKGKSYERTVLDAINAELTANPTFQDSDPAVSCRLKLPNQRSEEIDMVFRFGNVVVVGEVKSIVTTDSSISRFRTYEILLHAAEQAKRKKDFVAANVCEVFKRLNWQHDDGAAYNVIPVVLSSSSVCVGHTINGVPLSDLRILVKYFESGVVPLFSVNAERHLAWFEVYKNFDDAQRNIEGYLRRPPQISLSRDDFQFVTCKLPGVSERSPRIQFTRLVNSPLSVEKTLSKEFPFPILFAPEFSEEVAKIDRMI